MAGWIKEKQGANALPPILKEEAQYCAKELARSLAEKGEAGFQFSAEDGRCFGIRFRQDGKILKTELLVGEGQKIAGHFDVEVERGADGELWARGIAGLETRPTAHGFWVDPEFAASGGKYSGAGGSLVRAGLDVMREMGIGKMAVMNDFTDGFYERTGATPIILPAKHADWRRMFPNEPAERASAHLGAHQLGDLRWDFIKGRKWHHVERKIRTILENHPQVLGFRRAEAGGMEFEGKKSEFISEWKGWHGRMCGELELAEADFGAYAKLRGAGKPHGNGPEAVFSMALERTEEAETIGVRRLLLKLSREFPDHVYFLDGSAELPEFGIRIRKP